MSALTEPGDTPDDEADPLVHVRENREAVEALAAADREDSLAAWARVLLAAVDGERPDEADLEKSGLGREFGAN